MSPQADSVGVTNAHTSGDDKVNHAREFVDQKNGEGGMGNACLHAGLFEIGHADRADRRPGIVWEYAEDAIEVDGAGNS